MWYKLWLACNRYLLFLLSRSCKNTWLCSVKSINDKESFSSLVHVHDDTVMWHHHATGSISITLQPKKIFYWRFKNAANYLSTKHDTSFQTVIDIKTGAKTEPSNSDKSWRRIPKQHPQSSSLKMLCFY